MKISEQELVEHLKRFIDECDADELSRISGDVFGGNCYWVDSEEQMGGLVFEGIYEFVPNEFYGGEFGDIE